MVVGVFSVLDTKAQAFLRPFFAVNKAVAIRQFQTECQNQQSMFSQHPEDFCLFELGMWDENSGELRSLEARVSLGYATDYMKKEV